jgi:hypothetical protein
MTRAETVIEEDRVVAHPASLPNPSPECLSFADGGFAIVHQDWLVKVVPSERRRANDPLEGFPGGRRGKIRGITLFWLIARVISNI